MQERFQISAKFPDAVKVATGDYCPILGNPAEKPQGLDELVSQANFLLRTFGQEEKKVIKKGREPVPGKQQTQPYEIYVAYCSVVLGGVALRQKYPRLRPSDFSLNLVIDDQEKTFFGVEAGRPWGRSSEHSLTWHIGKSRKILSAMEKTLRPDSP